MEPTYTATADIRVLPYHHPSGAFGFLPMHAYLIKTREAVLVDTGISTESAAFLDALWREIEPEDLHWILLTHEDLDHSGALEALIRAAPNARLVLSFLAMIKLAAPALTPPERILIAAPGQSFTAGDRRFAVIRPPVFDSSATVAYLDEKTHTLFSADAFGGLVPRPATDVNDLGSAYADGCALFTTVNSVWLHNVDPAKFKRSVDVVRTLNPDAVLSAHAAPLKGDVRGICDHLQSLPSMDPVRLPDDTAFRGMLAQMKAGAAPGGPPA